MTSALQFDPRNALARYFIGRCLAHLPLFYQTIFRTWQALDGGLSEDNVLSGNILGKHSTVPLSAEHFSLRNVYHLLRKETYVELQCVAHFRPVYGPLHWPQMWSQVHLCYTLTGL